METQNDLTASTTVVVPRAVDIPPDGPERTRVPVPDLPGVFASIGALPVAALVSEDGLATALAVNKRTIRRMVQRGELPPGVPFAGRTTWLAGKIIAHFEQRAERAARDAERIMRKLEARP